MIDKKGLTKTNEIKDPFVLSYCGSKITAYIERLNKIDIDNWEVKEVTDYLKKDTGNICFLDYARRYKREMELVWKVPRNAYSWRYFHIPISLLLFFNS